MSNHAIHDKKLIELLEKQKDKEDRRDRLLRELAALDASIAETKTEYARAYNRYSRILGLPTEITTLIFQAAHYQTLGGVCPVYSWRDKGVEVVLSHICHSWRSIALSCPDLWTAFSTRYSPRTINVLSLYLERSHNRLLNLRFNIDSERYEQSWVKMVEKAVEQVSRWRRFSLLLDDKCWSDPSVLSDLIGCLSAPNLEVFEVCTKDAHDKLWSLTDFNYYENFPKLAYVRLDSLPFIFHGLRAVSNITTLQIEQSRNVSRKHSYFAFFEILKISSLVDLSLSGDPFHPPTLGQALQPVLAPNLKNFRCTDSESIARNIWSFMRAPRLEPLIIGDVPLDSTWVFPFSGNTIRDDGAPNLFPSLRSLAIINCEVSILGVALHLAHATET